MNSSVAGWLLCLTALCLWGSIGSLAKASAVQWSLFFKAYPSASARAQWCSPSRQHQCGDRRTPRRGVLRHLWRLVGCGGACASVLDRDGRRDVELSRGDGHRDDLGTFLLYLLDRDALNVGPLLGALLCVLGAVALEARRSSGSRTTGQGRAEEDGLLGAPATSAAGRWEK